MRQRLVPGFCAFLLSATLGAASPAFGQTINQLEVLPSPSCVGEAVTFVVDGLGNCNEVTISPGGGLPDLPAQNGTLPLQFLLSSGYGAAGTYLVAPKSENCTVTIAGGEVAHEVNSCRPQAGLAEDFTIGPRTDRVASVADVSGELVRLNPVITGGPFGGPIQPGNDAAVLVIGHYFPREGEGGKVELIGPWGYERLDDLAWNADGSGVAFKVPDNISGHQDQTALLVVSTAEGLYSNWIEVPFVAARTLRTLDQNEVDLEACSTSSDVDCCNDFYDADVIQWFCPTDPDASYTGFHMTQWGMPRADLGIDRYKISLVNGWVIEDIDLDVDQEEGESWARRISEDPRGSANWTEEIAWLTSPNDEVMYRATITIIGPRGVPHQ